MRTPAVGINYWYDKEDIINDDIQYADLISSIVDQILSCILLFSTRISATWFIVISDYGPIGRKLWKSLKGKILKSFEGEVIYVADLMKDDADLISILFNSDQIFSLLTQVH